MNKLSRFAENLFYRLVMKADDYGNMQSNPIILKSDLYPLQPTTRITEISQALFDLADLGIIVLYDAEEKGYLHIKNYRQQLRWPTPKHPLPPFLELKEKRSKKEKKRREVEDEVEEKRESDALPGLNKIKKILLDTGIAHFDKYFLKEKLKLNQAISKYNNREVPEADEKKLRIKYVITPVMTEVDKFANYNLAEIESWNEVKLQSKFFVWLDRKLEFEKQSK